MTAAFRHTFILTASGARGIRCADLCAEDGMPADWLQIERIAREQSVLGTVAYSLKISKEVLCPDEMKNRLIDSMLTMGFWNYSRRLQVFALLKRLKEAGVVPILLKGYEVASYYAEPESRPSGDVDIFVPWKDEKKTLDFLRERGWKITPRNVKSHHSMCHHPLMGLMEVHVGLYDELVEDVWFGKIDGVGLVVEPYREVETPDGAYRTLGVTDTLVFVTLHAVKHFIISGMSLRMMTDATMCFHCLKDRADIARYWATMRRLKVAGLVSTMFRCFVEYGGFAAEDFPGMLPTNRVDADMILTDLESGGYLGFRDKENRESGWRRFTDERLTSEKGKAYRRMYMYWWILPAYCAAMFPPKGRIVVRYPYVADKPWLLPYAYMHNIFVHGFLRFLKGELSPMRDADKPLPEAGQQRVEMFRKQKML